jgi:YesN/AraC family two-component response regulator
VITDVKMPLIDGIELSRYICKNHPNITTVILSGYAEFEYAQSAIQYHVSQYLLKPISKEKIMSCIKDIVKQKATELPADDSMNTAETAPKYSIFIKQAINYIDEHLTDDMTLETIAESVHSNASYLSRIFKKEVPDSLKESDPLMAEVLEIQSKAKYTYGQNQAYWYQNVIDTFSNLLPELAYGNITATEFCEKLTESAQKN